MCSESEQRANNREREREREVEEGFANSIVSLILMEKISHSRNPNRSASSLPKKPYNGSNNGGGFSYNSGKTVNTTTTTYDDVFGGPPRFGAPTLSPRLEDYCEIFSGFNGSSRAAVSSIPVLDLPLVDSKDVYFDVRSHGFDYREVFGGFNDLDLAPSYEELFMRQRSTVVDNDSSDDAWYFKNRIFFYQFLKFHPI